MKSNLTPVAELYVRHGSVQKVKMEAAALTSWDLTQRQICDLELLMNGGFSPLTGFLTESDYNSVVENMRLKNGNLWPMPITLDVSQDFADSLEIDQNIALRDQEGVILATIIITDMWQPNKKREAEMVFGADDLAHPAVDYLYNQAVQFIWVAQSPEFNNRCIMIFATAATRQTSCALIFVKWVGAGL